MGHAIHPDLGRTQFRPVDRHDSPIAGNARGRLPGNHARRGIVDLHEVGRPLNRVDFDGRKATAGRHEELNQSGVVDHGRHHNPIDQYLRIAEVISGERDEIAAYAGQQIHGKHRSDEGLSEAIASPSFVAQAIQIAVDTGTIAEPRLLAEPERSTGSVELGIEVQGVIAFAKGATDAVSIDVADGEDIATGAKGSGFRIGIVGKVIPPARGHHLSGHIVRNGPRGLRRVIVRGQV